MLAMNMGEMKMTGQLNGLGRNVRYESITRGARSRETQRLHADDLAVGCPAASMKISGQEQSL
jgi:hypothetical protein